jgi:hypothetical protein
MFKIEHEPRYWWPVTVHSPDPARPGEFTEQQFEIELRWVDDDVHDEWYQRVQSQDLKDRQAMPEMCTAFRGVLQEDGTPLACTPETLALLLRKGGVATAVAKAYFASRRQAAEKN